MSWMETPWVYSWLMRARRAPGQMLGSGSETFTSLLRRKETASSRSSTSTLIENMPSPRCWNCS